MGKDQKSEDYQLLVGCKKAVDTGHISPLVGLDLYTDTYNRAKEMFIGITAPDGTVIESISTHFIDRVIGQCSSPHKGMRQGVYLETVYDIFLSDISELGVKETTVGQGENKEKRVTFTNRVASVTIGVTEKRIIQCNLHKRRMQ